MVLLIVLKRNIIWVILSVFITLDGRSGCSVKVVKMGGLRRVVGIMMGLGGWGQRSVAMVAKVVLAITVKSPNVNSTLSLLS